MQSIKEISLKSWPPGAPTEAQYPLGKVPLAEYLKMRAQEHPDKPAIIFTVELSPTANWMRPVTVWPTISSSRGSRRATGLPSFC